MQQNLLSYFKKKSDVKKYNFKHLNGKIPIEFTCENTDKLKDTILTSFKDPLHLKSKIEKVAPISIFRKKNAI